MSCGWLCILSYSGGGKPLFKGLIGRLNFGLTDVQQYPSGLLMLTYQNSSVT